MQQAGGVSKKYLQLTFNLRAQHWQWIDIFEQYGKQAAVKCRAFCGVHKSHLVGVLPLAGMFAA